MALDRSLFSVVVPLFNEQQNVRELARQLLATFKTLGFNDYQVVLVSDGSTDATESILAELVESNAIFEALCLTRNFGHQAALCAGLAHARGSVVCVLDGDLQDPPSVLPDLVNGLERGADVAYGVRRHRKEHLLKRAAYAAFYRLMRATASIEIPLDAGDFCCMKRAVVDRMLQLPERTRFVRGLRAWVGYRQVGVPYERAGRRAGLSKFSLRQLTALAYDGIFSFSSLPVKLMQFLGFIISTLALITALAYLGWYLVAPGRFPAGWATMVISLWFIGGVQLLFMGLLGEYVYRTFDEARRRPTALVSHKLDHEAIVSKKAEPCEATTPKPMKLSIAGTGGGGQEKPSSSTRSAA